MLELGIGNSFDLFTYQLYHTSILSPAPDWTLLFTGARGQTNFALTNSMRQEFFRVGVLTNY